MPFGLQGEITVSALGGIYNFNNVPVDEKLLFAMEAGLASRGPDGGNHYKAGSIGMVYRAFHTNRESRMERQPLISAWGHVLCWDGRLDNREELRAVLIDELRGDQTDAGIVMAAYLKWGVDFLPKMIADFALSLWDPVSATLIFARDVIGSRDLYYQINRHRVMWATDLDLLLDASDIDLEVDEHYVAGYLTRVPETWQAPFKGIEAVPTAHAILIQNSQLHRQRYWGLSPSFEIRYGSNEEYEEHFKYLFTEAVRCNLRSDRPVWADLSGGLDSSSIVCMADQLIKTGQVETPKLETVSWIHDEAHTSDESKYIAYVEEKIDRRGHHLRESELPILSALTSESSIMPNALDIFASYYDEVNKLMAEDGARIRLCGNGGDEILNSAPDPTPELADQLVRCDLLQLHRSLQSWGRHSKKPYVKLFWENTLLPVLPRKLQLVLKHGPVKHLPIWYDAQFAKRTNLRDLMMGPADPFRFRLPSNRGQCISFLCAVREYAGGFLRILQKGELRLPMLHRPLIEFMQAIPQNQRARVGETRSLQRRALRDLLPPETLKRKGKGNPSEALFRAASREAKGLHALLSESYVARCGYVDQKALMEAVERYRYGDRSAAEVLRIVPLEFWLRSLAQRRSRPKLNTAAMGLLAARPAAVL